MNRTRINSSPDLFPLGNLDSLEDSSLEGVTRNLKLMLKLIQDHSDVSKEDDVRRPRSLTGMITILDDVKSRIEKSQRSNWRVAELRRCNTDLRRGQPLPKDRRPAQEPLSPSEENQRLRRELATCVTARKSLEGMFSSIGKEKQMMVAELARKVHLVSEMEELVGDLRKQNQMLTKKVIAFAGGEEKVREAVAASVEKIRGLRGCGEKEGSEIETELDEVEEMLAGVMEKLGKGGPERE